jgi:hypothetical protein
VVACAGAGGTGEGWVCSNCEAGLGGAGSPKAVVQVNCPASFLSCPTPAVPTLPRLP